MVRVPLVSVVDDDEFIRKHPVFVADAVKFATHEVLCQNLMSSFCTKHKS